MNKQEPKKFLSIFIALLIVVILICIFQYIHKFKIVAEYQTKILGLDNYIMETENMKVYVKNGVYVLYTVNETYYLVTDTNNSKQYMITSTGIEVLEHETPSIPIGIVSMFKLTNSDNMWELMKADKWIKLSKEVYQNVKCYKLRTNSENTRYDFTVYFDIDTKLPVAYKNQNEDLKEVKIITDTVTDEDVSMEVLTNKMNSTYKT